jgi:hypothetical protein
VYEVEIARAGEMPTVTALPCGELRWQALEWELGGREDIQARMQAEIQASSAAEEQRVVRATLRGLAAPAVVAELVRWLREKGAAWAVCDVRDETSPEFSSAELAELEREHALLAEVMVDLERFSTGAVGGELALSRTEVEDLEKSIGCAPGELGGAIASTARQLLLRELREVRTGC